MSRDNEIRSLELSPAEKKREKQKATQVIDRNLNITAMLWNVVSTLFLVIAGLIIYLSVRFIDIVDLNVIMEGVVSRQVNEAGSQSEFMSISVFTFAGVAIFIAGIALILSMIFGIRGAIFEEHKKGLGVFSVITSLGVFLLVIVPVFQFALSYLVTNFA